MKRVTLMSLVLAILAFAVVPAMAQENAPIAPTNTITVIGRGQAFGSPDMATIEVGVEITNADITTAFNETNTTMDAVIAALTEFGIAPEDLRTTNLSIYSDNYPQGEFQPEPVYRVNNILQITVRDIAQTPEVVSTAVNAGANRVYNLNFSINDRGTLEDDARANAVEDARARAGHLAEVLGVTLGDPIIITEIPSYGGIAMYDTASGLGGGAGVPPVQSGQLAVDVQLQITFSISR